MNQPIFVTGVERSGSTLVARIIRMCGAFAGNISTMHENRLISVAMESFLKTNQDELFPEVKSMDIQVDWWDKVQTILDKEGYPGGPWICKSSKLTQMWTTWHYAYPNARWVIVRRRTGDIIQSCVKTGYMRMFKNINNQEQVGVSSESEGWKWWVHQYEKQFVAMIEAGLNCRIVWPERMVYGDYQQMYETLDWLGLQWNDSIITVIDPILSKTRRKLDGMRNSYRSERSNG